MRIRISSGTDIKTGILFFTKAAASKLYDGKGAYSRGNICRPFPVCLWGENRNAVWGWVKRL